MFFCVAEERERRNNRKKNPNYYFMYLLNISLLFNLLLSIHCTMTFLVINVKNSLRNLLSRKKINTVSILI